MNRGLPYILDKLINGGQDFAAYRLPDSELVHILCDNFSAEDEKLFYNMEEINGRKGYIFAPFALSDNNPGILLRPSNNISFKFEDVEDFDGITIPPFDVNDSMSEEYMSRFSGFIAPLREGRFQKLVLSRSMTVKRHDTFSAAVTFLKLCRANTGSYVYMFRSHPSGLWIGCPPEVLLSGKSDELRTEALAGTCLASQWEKEKSWNSKNLSEQKLVADYIGNILESMGITPHTDTSSTKVGHLMHIRTDFLFSIKNRKKLGSFIKSLYPTPAVSGLPKEEAVEFILENEGYDRRYYSGLVGMLDPEGRCDLYVNIRCMNIEKDSLTVYAGGGLLPASQPQDEWQETVYKLHTISSMIT